MAFYEFNYKRGRFSTLLTSSPKLKKILIILIVGVILIVPFLAKIIVLVQNWKLKKPTNKGSVTTKVIDMPKTDVCREPNSQGQRGLLYDR